MSIHKTAAAALAIVLFAPEASAACVCRCVNGQMQAICSSSLDLPPICPPTICPLVPPSIPPIAPPTLPPLGTQYCAPQQVWNPYLRRYEWRTVCR